jgi:hypothetical protein
MEITKEAIEIKSVNTYLHNTGHSLTIEIDNTHIGMNTYAYDHRSGNTTSVDIYGMTPELMYELAGRIIDVANEISDRGM